MMRDNGTNKCRAYGQFLGERYKNFPNIIWMSGNDFQTWRTAADDAVVRAVAQGIQDKDTNHLQTTELDYVVSSSLDDASWNSVITLNATYTSYPTYARLQEDYNRTNFLPNFMVEANYEFESLQGPVTTAPILRKQEYWTVLSGGGWANVRQPLYLAFLEWLAGVCGYAGGSADWLSDHLPCLACVVPLVPDTNHTLVTAGFGTYSSTGHVSDNDYLAAARTGDGSLAMAYTPIFANSRWTFRA